MIRRLGQVASSEHDGMAHTHSDGRRDPLTEPAGTVEDDSPNGKYRIRQKSAIDSAKVAVI
jgi:hypothetical protein